ncbi:MAG: HAD family hydrolase, partial [Acutalibacteraceae bacterium]
MYKNYVFDLYGTLIDINTDEWCDDLWKKMAILYGYQGAHYTYKELNEEYDKLVQEEKKAVSRRHKDYSVI